MVSKVFKYSLVIVLSGVIAIVVLYNIGFVDKCLLKQIDIEDGLKKYDQTKDPELCAQLNDKISQFDDSCKSNLEILDCG